MSYIQVEIGGRLRGLKFTQGVNMLIKDKFLAFDKDERLAFGMQLITWAALKINCVLKGEVCDFTFEDVYNWHEVLPMDGKEAIANAYNDMVSYEDKIPDQVLTDDEKKNTPQENITTEQSVTESPVES